MISIGLDWHERPTWVYDRLLVIFQEDVRARCLKNDLLELRMHIVHLLMVHVFVGMIILGRDVLSMQEYVIKSYQGANYVLEIVKEIVLDDLNMRNSQSIVTLVYVYAQMDMEVINVIRM